MRGLWLQKRTFNSNGIAARAMKRGELTTAIFADFPKVFDTVDHTSIVKKNEQHGIFKPLPTLDSKLHWGETEIGTNQRQYIRHC